VRSLSEYQGLKTTHTPGDMTQVTLFYELQRDPAECYFWIYEGNLVYVFHALDLKVMDGEPYSYAREAEPERGSNRKRSFAKAIKCELVQVHKKIDLPEILSNLNSNQAYNRGTIRELRDRVKEVADAVYCDEPILVTKESYLEYLSPIQFETLGFVIFNRNGNFCSSYRGGTLKDYDLRVKFKNPATLAFPFEVSEQEWIQVKYKAFHDQDQMCFFVKVSDSGLEIEKVLDKSWIQKQCTDPNIWGWIMNTIYDYRWFRIIDVSDKLYST